MAGPAPGYAALYTAGFSFAAALGKDPAGTRGPLMEAVLGSRGEARVAQGCVPRGARPTPATFPETCSFRTATFSLSSFLSVWRALHSFSNRSSFIWKALYSLSRTVFCKKEKKNYVALNVNQVPRYQKIKLSEPHWKHLQSPLEHVQCLQPPPNTLVSLQIYVRIPHLCHYSGMTKSLYHV